MVGGWVGCSGLGGQVRLVVGVITVVWKVCGGGGEGGGRGHPTTTDDQQNRGGTKKGGTGQRAGQHYQLD